MAQIKIRYRLPDAQYPFVKSNGQVKRGDYCRRCGSRLVDPVSKKLGYGRGCFEKIGVMIILEIPAGTIEETNDEK